MIWWKQNLTLEEIPRLEMTKHLVGALEWTTQTKTSSFHGCIMTTMDSDVNGSFDILMNMKWKECMNPC